MKVFSRNLSSEVALDGLNFTLADVRDGVGPYLALFLVGQPDWTTGRIGWALSAASLATLLCTGPAGYFFDRVRAKRAIVVTAVLGIGASASFLFFLKSFAAVLSLQILMGAAAGLIAPGIANLSLGLVGAKSFAKRVGRNETFNHAGNFAASLLCAYLARSVSVESVFAVVIAMSIASVFFTLAIRKQEINFYKARGLRRPQETPVRLSAVFGNPAFLLALVAVFGFQLANASLLPIAAQLLATTSKASAVKLLSSGIVIAQMTAIPVAWFSGVLIKKISSFWIMGIGFLAILSRSLIFMLSSSLEIMTAAQIFDGIAAGVLAVAPVLMIFQLTRRTGHFTLATGTLASAISFGAAVSNALGGMLIDSLGAMPYYFAICMVAILSSATMVIAAMVASRQIKFEALGLGRRAQIA